ncbi:MAG: CHASE2 domain-containing protein [Gloeomargaritaceae cyanobacterium C42_A2020_066]|nr:CHASE2 domain-containing protein [Gloeomargaritaceae cyanobacterium C42_A2020_066]
MSFLSALSQRWQAFLEQQPWLQQGLARVGAPAVAASLVMGGGLTGLWWLGALQQLELGAYDQLVRLRPDEGPDPRFLVVAVTESDIQAQARWPLSDQTIATLIDRLTRLQPRVIGLDIYRDIKHEPGHARLAAQFRANPRLVAVCKREDKQDRGVPPPPSIPRERWAERVGFADLVVDPGGIVRRSLLSGQPQAQGLCQTPFSLGFQAALHYLKADGITPQMLQPQGYLVLGPQIIPPLTQNWGAYHRVDTGGYQIVLNYRSARDSVRQVTLTEALKGTLKPEWVRDKIVLIGVTADSTKDTFYTPYSAGLRENQKMPGVVIHAQTASQLLSAVLNGRPLVWAWPGWAEGLWIWIWGLVGGVIAWRIRHPGALGAALLGGSLVVSGIVYTLFLQGGWLPWVTPVFALVLSGGTVVAFIAYRERQEKEQIAGRVRVQEEQITVLRKMLVETQAAAERTEAAGLAAPAARDGSTLAGRYRVRKVLGEGGFGRTYLAQDVQRPGQPECVVKQLRPARSDPKFLLLARRLFNTEAEILEILGKHKQIPQLLAYFEEDQEFYLVQEYIKGTGLEKELVEGRPQSETYTVALLRGVLEVLAFVHEHKVIHRDLKPANIIRRVTDNRPVLIDFGAVKQMQPQEREEEEAQTIAIGTRGYSPPEQMDGRPQLSSDIYALGMIGIQALTGVPPRQLELDRHTLTPLWHNRAQVRPQLAKILDKMVQYFPSERYQSAQEVIRDLKQL